MEELGEDEAAELDALVARLAARLAPHVRAHREAQLTENVTTRFPRRTMALIERLASRFDISKAEVIRMLCSGYRPGQETRSDSFEELYRLVQRFAGAFEEHEPESSHLSHVAQEFLRQATAIYDAEG